MLGTVLSLAGVNLKRQVERKLREIVVTVVLATVGGILLAVAIGFGIALLHFWLKVRYGPQTALAVLAVGGAVLGLVCLGFAFLRPKGRRRVDAVPVMSAHDPAVAVAQATEQAVHNVTGLMREGSRNQVFGAIVIAALAGFLVGRRL
jgi:hypothetical protein